MTLITASAFAVAAVAAVRSTWSPCGVSMLSTITPIGERGRGHRWLPTAIWYALGGLSGGATLGALAAGGAALCSAARLPATAADAAGAVALLAAAASDLPRPAWTLPGHRRQVDERWLDRYRAWVYATGFGWQIGVGLWTYLKTAAVYGTIVLAALTGRPATAFLVGLAFGAVRGAAVFVGGWIRSPERLVRFHRAFAGLERPTRIATVAAVAASATVLLVPVSPWPAAAVAVSAALAIPAGFRRSRGGSRSARAADAVPAA